MRFALVVLLPLAIVAVFLATQQANLDNTVSLALPFTTQVWTGSVLAMLGGFFASGLVLGYLLAIPGRLGASRRARRAEKELAQTGTAATSARVEAAEARADARAAATEADEMQRLADEVARRTATVQRDAPPPARP